MGGPEWCEKLRQARQEWPWSLPWPIYPEPGGLFPWAVTDNGGTLYWLTEGEPDGWPTLHDPHSCVPEDWERHDLPFAELLLRTITGERGLFRAELGDRFEYGRPDAFAPWPWV